MLKENIFLSSINPSKIPLIGGPIIDWFKQGRYSGAFFNNTCSREIKMPFLLSINVPSRSNIKILSKSDSL